MTWMSRIDMKINYVSTLKYNISKYINISINKYICEFNITLEQSSVYNKS